MCPQPADILDRCLEEDVKNEIHVYPISTLYPISSKCVHVHAFGVTL